MQEDDNLLISESEHEFDDIDEGGHNMRDKYFAHHIGVKGKQIRRDRSHSASDSSQSFFVHDESPTNHSSLVGFNELLSQHLKMRSQNLQSLTPSLSDV